LGFRERAELAIFSSLRQLAESKMGGSLMSGKAAKVVITERQQEVLLKFRNATTVAKRLSQRAAVILLAFQGLDNDAIAERVGLERHAVGLWRRRWQRAFDRLVLVECADVAATLRQAITAVLADEPRPGCPGKFTPEQLTLLFALACEDPALSDRPITHWTGQELADEACQRGIVTSISGSQVNRLLREATLQPHKSRYWLNHKEKDPEVFQAQVEFVCACYHDAPALYHDHDTHTFSVDEMTGIQALERIALTIPMTVGWPARPEFEYKRHGTVTLIANFHVVTGVLVTPTLGPTRTEADFVRHIAQTIQTDAQAGFVFVVDQLNIHQSAGLVALVAGLCGVQEDLGQKGKRGVLKSMKSRQEFLSDLSHRIRFVYLPKHSSWLNQIEIVFGIIMRKVVRRGNFTSVADLRTKLQQFISYFNEVFAKPFKWTYTGRPLQK
jgi:transposase